MAMTPIPALDRTSATFKTDVDTFFGTRLPTFTTEANALQTDVTDKQATASNAATTATTKASEALTSANNAATSKTGADSARDAAVVAKNAAEAALDSFDDRYLGAKASAPATDNDGAALLTGALYWDTALPGMRSWNGADWVTLPAATAAAISNTPAGSIAATTVQAAINELDSEKVALSGGVMTGGLTVPRINGGQLAGTRNKIINGKMEIAQRGTSGAGTNTYTVDRWQLFHSGTALTWARQPGGVILGDYFSNTIEIAGAAGNTGFNFNQRIESRNSAALCGKTVTFSAYVLHANTGGPRNFSITAQRPNTADNWSSVTSIGNSGNISVPLGVWTRITWTTTLPESGPNLGLSFEIGSGAAVATQGVYITGVQLEVGSVATPFEHRPYGMEEALCQRYYEQVTASQGTDAGIAGSGSYTIKSTVCFATTKRTTPTVTIADAAFANMSNASALVIWPNGIEWSAQVESAASLISRRAAVTFAASAEL